MGGRKGYSMKSRSMFTSAVAFFYYSDLAPAAQFYEDLLGLEPVEDQGWARLYCVSDRAFLGIVDAAKGYHPVRKESSVMLTLVTDDVEGWYRKLSRAGVAIETSIQIHEDIGVKGFFLRDPGGYVVEIQSFLDPQVAARFGQGERPA
jgi:catechol 2,3-dioxygenase-like lactoylglutathione lyase family enzyme